ncbi:uncharacterized protein LOC143430748 [Xylocopa sonorina]|uniref:uncharacterized protein LOC143430748 n=1 Tax=Xylocopa sonorina TaxID=1818115 RepID=UPI00403B2C73
MDCKNNNIGELLLGLKSDGMQENWEFGESYSIDKELEDVKIKILKLETEYEFTEMQINEVNQLWDKGAYVLKNVEQQNNGLEEQLKEIHWNYMKCIEMVNSNEETVRESTKYLSLQRDNLKTELKELQKKAEEYDRKLIEVKKMITIQEKKNMALVRKLKKSVENVRITPNLRSRVNKILNDPRIANLKNSKRTID